MLSGGRRAASSGMQFYFSFERGFATLPPVFRKMKTLFSLVITTGFLSIASLSWGDTEPWKGVPHTIPGVIEAEHWDTGPAGVAYFDVDPENRGEDYREKTEVDIEKRSDASNGHGIGWCRATEWLVYTVVIEESGTYKVEIPVASKKEGGLFHLEINGNDVTGPIRIPDTGSWQQLELIEKEGISLSKGKFTLKLMMDENGESGGIGDIDLLRFIRTGD